MLWRLEPNTRFRTNKDVTRINSVGLRESLLPSQKKRRGKKRFLLRETRVSMAGVFETMRRMRFNWRDCESVFRYPLKSSIWAFGYSTEQTLRLLEEVGWSYEPDLVIVSNLFSDCNIDAFQDRVAMRLTNPQPSGMERLFQQSRLYCACYMSWANYQANLNQNPNRVLMRDSNRSQCCSNTRISTKICLCLVFQLLIIWIICTPSNKKPKSEMLWSCWLHWPKNGMSGFGTFPPKPSPDHVLPWFPYQRMPSKMGRGK